MLRALPMALAPSRRIGVYEILGHLGTGGRVRCIAPAVRAWAASSPSFLSSDALADRFARERLAREAQLASSLNHPNIVTIYDVDEEEGHPCIVMELIEGESLYRRLISRPLKTRAKCSTLRARWWTAWPRPTVRASGIEISNRRTSCSPPTGARRSSTSG
jgi:serine/threonine protein kinase